MARQPFGRRSLEFTVGFEGGVEARRALEEIGAAGRAALGEIGKAARETLRSGRDFGDTFESIRKEMAELAGEAARAKKELAEVARTEQEFKRFGATLRGFVGIFAGAFAVRSLVDSVDTMTELRDRLRLAIGDTADYDAVLDELARTANSTGQALDVVAEGFLRQIVPLREMRLSTQEALDTTNALTLALTVSGLRGERAASVQEALSKALAIGALKGDQLNTVIQSGGRIAELLAKELNVTTGALLSLGQQGKITSKVIVEAFAGSLDQLQADADAMAFTIQDSVQILRNSFLQYVGSLDQATGSSRLVSDAIRTIARNLDIIIPILVAFAAAWGLAELVKVGRELLVLGKLITTMTTAMRAGAAAQLLFLGPWILIGAAIAVVIGAVLHFTGLLDELYEKLGLAGEKTEEAAAGIGEINNRVADGIVVLPELAAAATAAGEETAAAMTDAAEESRGVFERAVDFIIGDFERMKDDVVGIIDAIADALASIIKLAKEAAKAVTGASGRAGGGPVGYAGGGSVRGPGSSRSDSIPAWLSNGEFVMQARAVRKYGLALMHAINRGALSFAGGGLVEALLSPMSQGLVPSVAGLPSSFAPAQGGISGRPVVLNFPDGQSFEMLAPEDVADKLIRYATKAEVRLAGRKPPWYTG